MIPTVRLYLLLLLSSSLHTGCYMNEARVDKEKEEMIRQIEDFSKKMSNQPLEAGITVERFMTGDTLSLSGLFASGQTCVLQYSELDCNVCVDSAVHQFSQFTKKVGEEHAIIIAASNNPRYMASFVQVNGLRANNVYVISHQDYERLYKGSVNKPFVYTVNKQLLMSDPFLLFKEIPRYTDAYYASLFNKYFHQ